VDLLYDAKDGLLPQGAEVPDLETAYAGMIKPFLFFDRSNLANQAMALLAQVQRKEEASLQLAIARLNLDSGNLQHAEESLKEADPLVKPRSPLAGEKEELWGVLYETLGNTTQAKQHFELSVQSEPERPLPLRKLAEITAKNESWDEAAMWMERFIATKPASLGHYWAMLGDYRLAGEHLDEAVQALETALRIDPYVYWAHYRMARVFEQRKDTENAIREYEFMIKYAFDRDADIYVKLATVYKDAGRKRDAIRVLAKGSRILPTNPSIYRLYREIREVE
jgi:tetratricopeptide (TPR) repeat protein